MLKRHARLAGMLPGGRKVYRIPYVILRNDSRACETVEREEGEILARSATEAANFLRDSELRPETEFHTWGPQGGHVHRYHGWESVIAAGMWQSLRERDGQIFNQLPLEV